MSKRTLRIIGASLYFIPVKTRTPFQFGIETLTEVICARAMLRVRADDGRELCGWGETPLNVQWVWPSKISYQERCDALQAFCVQLAKRYATFERSGHPLEIGHAFTETVLPEMLRAFNASQNTNVQMPWLAALVCSSPFDIALYDAFGKLVDRPVFETLSADYLSTDLSAYLAPADDCKNTISFAGKYPADFLDTQSQPRTGKLTVWHVLGESDAIDTNELTGREPKDEYPVTLRDWIVRDGLRCVKIKLRGNNAAWDYQRLVSVGRLCRSLGVQWLCFDFNCTAESVAYVTDMLDRLMRDEPAIHGMLLYVEQPFPYELEQHPFDVHAVSARKPLFMDESAHDWRLIRRGRELGWSCVALKTCKTLTGALLSLCWAKAHGMMVMVQDLTNPMLAIIPHVELAARAGTLMGVECNAMQFYPDASRPEAAVHPGLHRRRDGCVDLSSLTGPGFSYKLDEIARQLPDPAVQVP